MELTPMTKALARRAIREAVRSHLFDPNVALIDLGFPEHEGRIAEDELAIRFHVRRKMAGAALQIATEEGYTRPIPPEINGFPTDVPEGEYHLHGLSWYGPSRWRGTEPRQGRSDPIHGGISISDPYHYAAGTLGGKVIDRATRAEMILSNWHVLVCNWGSRAGQFIYQPGQLDGGTYADTVATLTRHSMSSNLDAAVATLTPTCNRALINEQLGLGPVMGAVSPELGMEVAKSGRTSGVTNGRVEAIYGTAHFSYSGIDWIINNIVTIGPKSPGRLSAAGDSGAWWLDAETRRAVGLHFAGSDYPSSALALDMPSVLDALDVDIATERHAGTPAYSAWTLEMVTR